MRSLLLLRIGWRLINVGGAVTIFACLVAWAFSLPFNETNRVAMAAAVFVVASADVLLFLSRWNR